MPSAIVTAENKHPASIDARSARAGSERTSTMSFSTVTVGQIFSVGNSRSTQEDGKSQFALSSGWRSRNDSRQGQNNDQRTTTPNEIQVRFSADRPRFNGHVDILAIDGVRSDADSESFEGQGLQQEALGALPNVPYGFSNSSVTHGMGANKGEQLQRNRQGADADNHIDSEINQPGTGLPDGPEFGAEIWVDNVDADATNKNTQLQDIGQRSAVKKDRPYGHYSFFCQPAQTGGWASNRADQGQGNDQTARARNYLGLRKNGALNFCPPAPAEVGSVTQHSTNDSLQAQNLDQQSLTTGRKEADPSYTPLDILSEIAYVGHGLISGEPTLDAQSGRAIVEDKITEQLTTGPDQQNDQAQIASQHSEASTRGRSKNNGAQEQQSDQTTARANSPRLDFKI